MTYQLLCGDVCQVLNSFPENYFDGCLTDAPYGIAFMGKSWDSFKTPKEFELFILRSAISLCRVMKPGAFGLCFGSAKTYHRMTCGVEDAGFMIKDCLGWLYGEGMPKTASPTGLMDGKGTGLKPSWEPIVLFQKPMTMSLKDNLATYGTGALNIDLCRVGDGSESKERTHEKGVNNRDESRCATSFKMKGSARGGSKKGRWPANLILDGSQEVDSLFPNSGKLSASRFFYHAKASKKDKNEGLPEGIENKHPTAKPTVLCEYLARLITPSGGFVIDPFCGSGSSGVGAARSGLTFVGVDKDKESIEVAGYRIKHAVRLYMDGRQ